MEQEIKIPNCCEYSDCRPEKKSQIEEESIKAFARGLNEDGLKIFLDELSDEELIAAIHLRLISRQNKLDCIAKHVMNFK